MRKVSDSEWERDVKWTVENFRHRQTKIQKTLFLHSTGVVREYDEAGMEGFSRQIVMSYRPDIYLNKKPEFKKLEKLRREVSKILESDDAVSILISNGMDPKFQMDMAYFAYGNLYKGKHPKAGPKPQNHYLAVATALLEIYPMIAGREAGSNQDHNFVMLLGQIYTDLEGGTATGRTAANPQHYARKAIERARKTPCANYPENSVD
ncbi:hypothetical protein EOE18_14695 [Novosphingobium umbonatum]|uniref:Uncharacterized protein n=1 Tax=Novosphingobium umbonatum TaxID=1908524 RepID=A0A437N1L2_9SPHN|nr:hypothetical protein [Novosphingobium umbonatum]RVU03817.1 hypothetical protein EOE18_14695 [Novosphingobium umbonatum]